MSSLKLTIELVPSSCWFSNVRDHVSSTIWSKIKKHTFEKAGHVCEICNSVGPKWPVECHEVWEYDDVNKIQKLTGTVSLCPDCHMVKHIGFANVLGKSDIAKAHFASINSLTMSQAGKLIGKAFNEYEERSKYDWKLDLSWLTDTYGLDVIEKR